MFRIFVSRMLLGSFFAAVSCLPSMSVAALKRDVKGSESSQDALLKEISSGFSRVAKQATPAVVYIECFPKNARESRNMQRGNRIPHENPFDYFNDEFFNRFFGFPSPRERSVPKEAVRGTGFIVSRDGFIVTNHHVVEDAGKINVTLHDGQKYPATMVGIDPKTDLAVIRIKGDNLPYLQFGNSDKLEVGDWSIAIGNPFGLQATVTVGVISAKGRNQLHIVDFEDFIQTDAAINPGNSGGPLLGIDGKVIGVNTAIVSGSGGYMGIGFAIPSLMASRIIDQLIKEGQVTRGFLGVTLQPIDSELASCYKLDKVKGAMITDVVKGSPADKAGLKQEDIIVACNGKEIESLSAFRNSISLMTPGARVVLTIVREGKCKEIAVVVALAPREDGTTVLQKVGITVQNITPESAKKLGLGDAKGVLIVGVEPGSAAASSGIAAGQVILAVNRQKITSIEELNKVLKESHSENILLMVSQGDVIRFVALKPEE